MRIFYDNHMRARATATERGNWPRRRPSGGRSTAFVATVAAQLVAQLVAQPSLLLAEPAPLVRSVLPSTQCVADLRLFDEAPEPTTLGEQMRSAIPIKTVRGTWRLRESGYARAPAYYPKKARGVLTFRGFVDQPNRGIVEYTDGDGATAKGRWVIKPYRITRLVAEWNLRFDGGAPSRAGERHQYRGFVSVDRSFGGERPDAQIVGDVVDLEDSKYGLRRETRIGTFEADLIELFDSEKKL